MSVTSQAEKARQSALKLQGYSTDDKNKVLSAIAEGISAYKDFIIAENKKDLFSPTKRPRFTTGFC